MPVRKSDETIGEGMEKEQQLTGLGFSFSRGSVHTSRTMMLHELRELLEYMKSQKVDVSEYRRAIVDENCLRKRSTRNRLLTYRHLVGLYSLDYSKILFRSLLYFWNRDVEGQPLIALLCAYTRDPIFRLSAQFILALPHGTAVRRDLLEEYIESEDPGRFSRETLESTVRHINSTWTKSGHLSGRREKIRTFATPSSGSASYALLLGYLTGVRGPALFETEYVKLLDCTYDKVVGLAESASSKGWIVFKRVDNVVEVLFPNLIDRLALELLREQN